MIQNIQNLYKKCYKKCHKICINKLMLVPEGHNIAQREEKEFLFYFTKNIFQKIYL